MITNALVAAGDLIVNTPMSPATMVKLGAPPAAIIGLFILKALIKNRRERKQRKGV